MAKSVYKITINNWEKHNQNKKKNHRYFLLENRFFEDATVSNLRQIEVLLFIKCLCIAGDLSANSFQIHAGLMPKRWRIDDKLLENCLNVLQENQLLIYEKSSLFINRIEKKRIEENRKEKNIISPVAKKSAPASCLEIFKNDPLIESLFDSCSHSSQEAWLSAYSYDFITQEAKKANAWCKSNPQKAPKNFQRFFANWLSRAYESHRKGIPSRRLTNAEINSQAALEAWKRIDDEEKKNERLANETEN